MRLIPRFALSLSSILSWATLQAQPLVTGSSELTKFTHLTVEQGLSQNTIQCILQDTQGFLWFGTQDGLNRYDGHSFVIYEPDPQNAQSISDNRIESLFVDHLGILWIGTQYGGLNQFDPATETFHRYQHEPENPRSLSSNNVLVIYESAGRDGALWVGTDQGLNQFDRASATFRRFQVDSAKPHSLRHNSISAICEDRFQDLWIGTVGGGLSRMRRQDQAAGVFQSYEHDPRNPQSLISNIVNALCEDEAGRLWIGTSDGLACLRRQAAHEGAATDISFRNYQHDPENPSSLSQNYVRSIYADRSRVIWIGTRGGGLDRFDPEIETPAGPAFQHYQNDPQNPSSLSSNDIFSICEDRSGGMWIGSRAGINRFELTPTPFRHFQHDPNYPRSLSDNSVWAIYGASPVQEGEVWIGTLSGGLDKFDRSTGTFTHFRHDAQNPSGINDNSVWSIYQDHVGTLWIGTQNGGLNQFDRSTQTFRHFRRDPQNPQSLSHNWVTSIHEDAAAPEVLWIGTWGGGLHRFDRNTESFKNYRNDSKNHQSICSNGVWLIYEDRSGFLWLGTESGLELMDRATETFKHYQHDPNESNSLSNNSVWSICEDRAGRLWVGTSNGLNRLQRETATFKHFRERDGLPNDVIYGILEDDHGNLWLSTNKGLSKFNPQTGAFRNYDVHDGLQSNEFNADAAFRDQNGEMYFGGINGFNVFHPDSIKDNPFIPPVVITGLKRYNTDVAEGIAITEKGITAKPGIELSYKDEILVFEVAALNYRNSTKNQYAYKLEGLHDRWIQLGPKREITFTNLDPGGYTLRVKGSNNDGVWNEEGTSLKITITPPWWRTRWAYAGYGLLLIAAVFSTDRIMRRRLLAKERAQAQIREAELRVQTAEAQTQVIETQAKMLRAENERKEMELQNAAELRAAYEALGQAHEHLKATQQQLITQEKLASLGQLTAGIAHEIKNPLNFVNNFAVMSVDLARELREHIAKAAEQGAQIVDREGLMNIEETLATLIQNAEKINHHGKRADSIVKSMMQHARSSSPERELTDLNQVLDEVVSLVYHGMRAQDASFNLTIDKDYDQSLGKVEIVPQDISRVFLNVLNNACYAVQARMGEAENGRNGKGAPFPISPLSDSPVAAFSPALSVSTKNLGDKVEIRIRDNGTGIPVDIQEKIFDPFFTTKPAGQGIGLGLSISYDIIVQQHQGEIRVETEQDKFTEFILSLPRNKRY